MTEKIIRVPIDLQIDDNTVVTPEALDAAFRNNVGATKVIWMHQTVPDGIVGVLNGISEYGEAIVDVYDKHRVDETMTLTAEVCGNTKKHRMEGDVRVIEDLDLHAISITPLRSDHDRAHRDTYTPDDRRALALFHAQGLDTLSAATGLYRVAKTFSQFDGEQLEHLVMMSCTGSDKFLREYLQKRIFRCANVKPPVDLTLATRWAAICALFGAGAAGAVVAAYYLFFLLKGVV